jgi:DNA-binding IclR family transcriptional regulator
MCVHGDVNGWRYGLKDAADGAPSGGVEAVDRALAILATFGIGQERQSLTELATRTGFYKSTILRLAQSLTAAGYLHREEGGAFILGPEPTRLAAVYRRLSALESRVRPILRDLRDETGESASFFRRVGEYRQCLYREDTRRTIREHVLEGDLLTLDSGAAGRVLRTFAETVASAQLAELPFRSQSEQDPESASIAAPVFDGEGLVGALTISGPRTRLTGEAAQELAPRLMAKAEALSKVLGGALPSAAKARA